MSGNNLIIRRRAQTEQTYQSRNCSNCLAKPTYNYTDKWKYNGNEMDIDKFIT